GCLTESQLRDELKEILPAGSEPPAAVLAWTCHLLALHPEVQATLHREVETVLRGRAATPDDLRNLRYTTMVLREVMRLYPPVWLMKRRCRDDAMIGGFHVRAGATVL